MHNIKIHRTPLLLLITSCVLYWSFGYDLQRTDFIKLVTLFGALFFLGWKLYQLEKWNPVFLLGASLVFRMIFLFGMPNLSQDFYRFIWDGELLLAGLNPYLSTPELVLSKDPAPFHGAADILTGMGGLSAGNPTSYPPLTQLLFAIGAWLGNSLLGAVFALRFIIIAADIGTYLVGRKLLAKLGRDPNRIFLYLLNPLVIIELTGNLHFEGIMVFLVLCSLYFLNSKKLVLGALFMAFSISIKLIPLIFLPLFFRKLGAGKAITFYALVGIISLLLFLPFFSPIALWNFLSSINLWFQKFEFNASVYYVVRWIGYQIKGYNIIQSAGPILALLTFTGTIFMALKGHNRKFTGLFTSMTLVLGLFLFLSTTVHPWYIITALALSVFTKLRFIQVWSLVVVLSYFAYSNPGYRENLWLLTLEYAIVIGVLIQDLRVRLLGTRNDRGSS